MSELYKEAAQLLQKLEKRQGGLKTLAYADNVMHKRSSFALVCETLRYKPLLRQLLAAVPQFKFQKKVQGSSALLYVSLYDLLFGREKIQGGGHLKKELMQFHNAFKAALVRMKIKAKVSTNEGLLPEENRKRDLELPRYVRINALTITPEETQAFIDEYKAEKDTDVKDLLVLPHGTELHENELATAGKLVLQDKASCFPAYILHGEHTDAPSLEGDVIDACAAPGNKTCHVAMLLHQQPEKYKNCKVFAFDRSPKRLELLKRRMKIVGADGIVEPCLQSFLEIDVHEKKYANVRSILLDPSCSGSGMTNRLDHLLDIASGHDEALENEVEDIEGEMTARVQSLADFQLEALLKAFSFPQVQRITYSTCSIFQKENEEVVVAALNSEQNQKDPKPFVLKPCLQTWPRRGMEIEGLSAEQAKALVRANGLEDSTNGFFVAYFERSSTPMKRSTASNASKKTKVKKTANKPAQAEVVVVVKDDEGGDEEADSEDEDGSSKKRKNLSDAQKENRKRRKREKRKQSKQKSVPTVETNH